MQSYDDLVNLARICIKQAREATDQPVSARLMLLAKEYQERAAELDKGKLPDIGEE
ncbi:MAG: hypothetical protein ACLPKB_06585 [Xanthobacteraceae bacterium]